MTSDENPEVVEPPTAATHPNAPANVPIPHRRTVMWAAGGAAGMVVGAFAPWATVLGFISVSGTGTGYGWPVVIAALVGGWVLYLVAKKQKSRKLLIVALLGGIVSSVITIYALVAVQDVVSNAEGLVQTGWGIYLDAAASVTFTIAVGRLLISRDGTLASSQQPSGTPS